MAKSTQPRPTGAELEILHILWDRGASTVRDVHDTMNGIKPTGYTTVLKLMQIMAEKGLVRRNEEQRAHVYEAVLPKDATQQQLVGDLLDRAFGGSAQELVMQALATRRATNVELDEIRRLLDEYEKGYKMSATVTALAWTLIHFLWQGGLIAAVLALALRAARNSRANVRYLLACTAMAAMFGSAVGTFLWISRPAEVRGAPAALAASSNPAPEPAAATPATPQKDASTPFSNYLSWLVYLWATGVLALSIRTGAGFVVAQRLKHRLASPLDPAWQQRFARLAQRLEIARTVRACESALAEVPSVVGWIRPVVLVPASALLNLPPCEIEALLAHELAHIRRHDYLVNPAAKGD